MPKSELSGATRKDQILISDLMRLYPQVRTLVDNMCRDGAPSADKLAAQTELKKLLTAGFDPNERLTMGQLARGVDPQDGSIIGDINLGAVLGIGPNYADRLIALAKATHDRSQALG